MRNNKEKEHFHCEEILQEISNCSIFDICASDIEEETEGDFEYAQPGEFIVCNEHCVDDPIFLTKEELKRLGQELIDLAEST